MNKLFKNSIAVGVIAIQLLVPLAVLAQQEPAIQSICDVFDIVGRIARYLLIFLILLAVIFVILAAFKYLTAGGDSEKVGEANKQIIYAAVAVAVGLLATAVPRIVMYFLGGDPGTCAQAGDFPIIGP